MLPPKSVRDDALNSFRAPRLGVGVAHLVRDSLVDPPQPGSESTTAAHRTLHFAAEGMSIRTDVVYCGRHADLRVTIAPPGRFEASVLHLKDVPRLVVAGPSPLQLQCFGTGPVSLAVTRLDPDGSTLVRQTAWLVL